MAWHGDRKSGRVAIKQQDGMNDMGLKPGVDGYSLWRDMGERHKYR